jgi:hypothetical protein
VVEVVVGVHERDVLVDAAGADVSFVGLLCAAEPATGRSAPGADVEVVANTDDPDGHRLPQATVASA